MSQHEVLDSLGLDLSDESEDELCYIAMDQMECGEERDELCNMALHQVDCGEEEEDESCNMVMDGFERQQAFQDSLIEQGGGTMNREVGSFHFDLEPL